jgi:hypothetical protein
VSHDPFIARAIADCLRPSLGTLAVLGFPSLQAHVCGSIFTAEVKAPPLEALPVLEVSLVQVWPKE